MSTLPAVVRRIAALSFLSVFGPLLASQNLTAQVPALAPAGSTSSTPIAAPATAASAPPTTALPARHNVILFIADGLRRGSVNPTDTPTLYRLRTEGVDLQNSHSVFPTVTTANASVIATGHGLGDTGNFGNDIYPGFYLTDPFAPASSDSIAPFLENDDVLASMNAGFNGNYIHETTLLQAAHDAGFNVAAVGKLGPTAIQLLANVHRNQLGQVDVPATIILDESTGHSASIPLPLDFAQRLAESGLPTQAPLRTNGYATDSQWSNGYSGNAAHPGTLAANVVQEKWLADVTTQVILPGFADAHKPFALLFWSRDPDGSQHNQGDSFQQLSPGIDGPTSRLGVRNADNCLKQLLDYLDAHPDLKATTDVLVTSDHGFATISHRELDAEATRASTPSAALTYKPALHFESQLPPGFLGIDLALFTHQRLFDPSKRAATGASVYQEIVLDGETSTYPSDGHAILGDKVTKLDASDARLIVESNGGTDYIYVPSKDPAIVTETIAALSQLDYVAGIFVDDAFCPTDTSCPGALPMTAVGLKGSAQLPQPTIAVSFKHFLLKPGDIQSGVQVTDGGLQEGQGNHGGLARDQTLNNMAAIGPDFKRGYIDANPVGNIDITPTLASILGINMPSIGKLKGRVMTEALASSTTTPKARTETLVSAPAANGRRTILHYQQSEGVHYYDRACMIAAEKNKSVCPE